jgi:hypothetical protein
MSFVPDSLALSLSLSLSLSRARALSLRATFLNLPKRPPFKVEYSRHQATSGRVTGEGNGAEGQVEITMMRERVQKAMRRSEEIFETFTRQGLRGGVGERRG